MVTPGVLIEQKIVPWRILKESSCMPFRALLSLEAERLRHTTDRAERQVAATISAPETSFHQTVRRLPVANHIFLGSWMVHICQECPSLRSAPRGDTRHIWD